MKRYLFLAALAAAAFVSCNKAEESINVTEQQDVRFSVANLGTYEFKSPTVAIGETGTATVGIYAADLGANHVEADVDGTSLVPKTAIKWGVGQTSSTSFAARYPYANANASGEYVMDNNQSGDAFTYQANLMTAVIVASPSTVGGVVFDFKHPFSQVVINVTNNLGGDAVESVQLTGMKCKATTFDVSTMPVSITLSEAVADTKDMTAYRAGESVYKLIVFPQSARPNIVVTTDQGSVYTFQLAATYSFEAGKTATTSVTLNPVGGSTGAGVQQSVSFGFTTVNWADAASNPTNSETSKTLGNYWHVIGCVYDDAHKNITTTPAWNFDYPMALGSDGKWSVTINYDEAMSNNGKGLKLRRFTNGVTGDDRWTTQFGFQTGTADDWTLASGDTYVDLSGASNSKNIRLASKGQWTLVLDDNDLTATRLGDVTVATVTE